MKRLEIINKINLLLNITDIKYIGIVLRKKEHIILKNNIILITDFLSNKTSISERIYCIINNITSIKKCIICNQKKVRYYNYYKGYGDYCGLKCMGKSDIVKNNRNKTNKYIFGVEFPAQSSLILNKMKETNIKKYGVDNPMKIKDVKDKLKSTNMKKYGVDNPMKNIDVKNKTKKTNIKKYGVDNPMKIKEVQDKLKSTNMKKYGVDNPMKNENVKKKQSNTNILKYNTPSYSQTSEYKYKRNIKTLLNRKDILYDKYMHYINENFKHNINIDMFTNLFITGPYDLICNKCNYLINDKFIYSFENNRFARCFKCNPILKGFSNGEMEIGTFIKIINKSIIIENNNRKILKGKELDLYLPEKKLAIEYNGLMFHSIGKHKSSMFNNSFLESDLKNKHLFKTEECKKHGIQLLHIFENEWLDPIKQNIWKNIIKTKLGFNKRIYGRNTYIKLVSNEVSKEFLNMYHLQGNIPSKLKIGLFSKKGELLSLMTFGKSRYGKADWELLRYVSKEGISIIGGASKIFKYFLDNYLKIGEIIKTYADKRFSDGKLYETLGFQLTNISKPNYFYFKTNSYKLESRIKYQKHKLKNKLKKFDINLTESENMYNNDYRKIYDCGNYIFKYIKE